MNDIINLPLPINCHLDSISNKYEWDMLKDRLIGWGSFCDMQHHIEAKALAVISIARRLICSAWKLGNDIGWKRVFVESSTLIFPMLELIGYARLGEGNPDSCLAAGAEWLLDPDKLPNYQSKSNILNDQREITSLVKHMKDHKKGPDVKNLIYIRNYFLHGLKKASNKSINIADLINYELPLAISLESQRCLKIYWQQIKTDDCSKGWVERLSRAEIQPFIIQGSGIYEQGLVDPDILDWLENPNADCQDLYTSIPG